MKTYVLFIAIARWMTSVIQWFNLIKGE